MQAKVIFVHIVSSSWQSSIPVALASRCRFRSRSGWGKQLSGTTVVEAIAHIREHVKCICAKAQHNGLDLMANIHDNDTNE